VRRWEYRVCTGYDIMLCIIDTAIQIHPLLETLRRLLLSNVSRRTEIQFSSVVLAFIYMQA
jgi:hypothetical protein